MLKALELVGFKSFADKTRFEFPPGITVVVGPNGSGKSNIVDAIKWVLGEQSVKSLRGQEMADVIFNGSGSRRPINSAETTLTFDNRQRTLPVDTEEVHVTRRVYRSGEGEYLLNGQPCRLRDIRDVFAGTGVSTQAYSIIEQGKVDVLLSSSPRDRRLIFEEAAGISRFRAKKIEALRRLERVDQNLLRLSDIVEEVENRLKVVRLQAAKAKRYKAYVDRLQELRTQVGLADWRRLSEQLGEFDQRLAALRAQAAESSAQAETSEVRGLELEREADQADEAIRGCERRLAENRERIATCESTVEHQRAHSGELEQEIERCRRQVALLSTKAGDLSTLLEQTVRDVSDAEQNHRLVSGQVADGERTLTELTHDCDALRERSEAHRGGHTELLLRSAEMASEISGLRSRVAIATAARERGQQRLKESVEDRTRADAELIELAGRQQQLTVDSVACQRRVEKARGELAELEQKQAESQQELDHLRVRHASLQERSTVLEELEARQEGVSAGAKELMARSREASAGALTTIRGLVADVLRATVETAPLVEAALGDKASYVVAQSDDGLTQLLAELRGGLGRVGLVSLDAPRDDAGAEAADLEGRAGVLGRADTFVECESQYLPLARRLLGRTWFVENLARALEYSASAGGVTFVTMAGEVVAADGTLLVGAGQGVGGLISRRSELRVLSDRIATLTQQLDAQIQLAESLGLQATAHATRVETLSLERERLSAALSELSTTVLAAEDRRGQLVRQEKSLEEEHAAAATEEATITELIDRRRNEHVEMETAVRQAKAQVASDERRLADFDQQCQQRLRETTLLKVELAKSEQRLDHLRTRLRQLQQDQHERQRAVEEGHGQLARSDERAKEAQRLILAAESEIAGLFLLKEALAAEAIDHAQRREAFRSERGLLAAEIQQHRAQARKIEADIHREELSAGEVRHERNALADRLREDYNIELAELGHAETAEEQHVRSEVEEEIAALRRKISNIGSVNLEALPELDELETRFTDLSTQYRDLSSAKKSLEEIIEKINADSRRLFTETVETVRGHFQGLFRKLFGGGQADIVLDDAGDILESGLEIVARPPGKEPRSISLLSGGEKTLTCVALLLAIFRSKPSPFCVLDEVDAALDEANIGRFVSVLQDFLQWTQFIVVTHSKKTMTCAGTLYGVTMQESGISKRVSVRFEDVSDNGEILRAREEAGEKTDETQAA